ncbi:MAG TPA: DUF5906 domain-containing protein [Clostridia bacterium]|nr:DUF5906 domain-containing protein [Clostridia bacterium]
MSSEIAEAPKELITLPEPCIAEERNLLSEARHRNFKTPEEGEAFLREEDSNSETRKGERALLKIIEILKEEITAAQKKEDNNNEFDASRCITLMNEIIPIANSSDRVMQAIAFIKEHVLSKTGKITEMEMFIDNEVFNKFGISNAKLKKYETDEIKPIIKAKRKGTDKNINPSPEFNGLWSKRVSPITGEETVTLHIDDIAEKIVEEMNVMTYKDCFYYYNEKCGYFKEGEQTIEAEAIRIDRGIMKGTRSNGSVARIANIMKQVSHINRVSEFPFRNEHKVIPVENGILKIDFETGNVTLSDPDPSKYRFNYRFPIIYNPEANQKVVYRELRKYVKRPRLIIQIVAQAIAQTLVDQPYKLAHFMYGQPNYGKSFIAINLIQDRLMLDDIISKIPLSRLSTDSDNKFSVASLEGKVMNIKDEMALFNMKDANTFKEVTGTFNIWAEYKGKMGYAARTTAVHLFVANKLPKFENQIKDDDGFLSRVQPINFNVTEFKKDTQAAERILTDEFVSGVFNASLKMAIKMVKTGNLSINTRWEEAREEWMQNSEPAYKFISENMEKVTNDSERTAILKNDLLRQIQLWYDKTFSDSKFKPNTVNDLIDTIKLCGGDLDAKRTFFGNMYDKNGNKLYKKGGDEEYLKDENGNNIPIEGESERHCYIIPYKWKNGNEYGERCKKCTTLTENAKLNT